MFARIKKWKIEWTKVVAATAIVEQTDTHTSATRTNHTQPHKCNKLLTIAFINHWMSSAFNPIVTHLLLLCGLSILRSTLIYLNSNILCFIWSISDGDTTIHRLTQRAIHYSKLLRFYSSYCILLETINRSDGFHFVTNHFRRNKSIIKSLRCFEVLYDWNAGWRGQGFGCTTHEQLIVPGEIQRKNGKTKSGNALRPRAYKCELIV